MPYTIQETTTMNTNIQTIGRAVLMQTAIRYGAFVAMTWIVCSFADGWVIVMVAQ